MNTPNTINDVITRLDADFSAYRDEVDGKLDADRVNANARMEEIEISQARAVLPPYGAGGHSGRPGQLLTAVREAAGVTAERSASRTDGGAVEIPWGSVTPPQAAITNPEHLIPRSVEYGGLGILRGHHILGDPRVNMLRVAQDRGAGDVALPVGSGASASWVADGAPLVDAGLSLSPIVMSAKRTGAIVTLPFTVLTMADEAASEAAIAADLGAAVGSALDKALLAVSATASGPSGLSSIASDETGIGANGQAVTAALLGAQLSRIEAHNAQPSAWLMHPATARKLGEIPAFAGSAEPLLQRGPRGFEVLQVPVIQSSRCNVTGTKGTGTGILHEIIAGAFDQLAMVVWGSLEVMSGHATGDFERNAVSLRVSAAVDFAPMRSGAFDRVSSYIA